MASSIICLNLIDPDGHNPQIIDSFTFSIEQSYFLINSLHVNAAQEKASAYNTKAWWAAGGASLGAGVGATITGLALAPTAPATLGASEVAGIALGGIAGGFIGGNIEYGIGSLLVNDTIVDDLNSISQFLSSNVLLGNDGVIQLFVGKTYEAGIIIGQGFKNLERMSIVLDDEIKRFAFDKHYIRFVFYLEDGSIAVHEIEIHNDTRRYLKELLREANIMGVPLAI